MSNLAERPDELNRLLTVSEAIESLSAIFAAEEPLDDVLLRISHTPAKCRSRCRRNFDNGLYR